MNTNNSSNNNNYYKNNSVKETKEKIISVRCEFETESETELNFDRELERVVESDSLAYEERMAS